MSGVRGKKMRERAAIRADRARWETHERTLQTMAGAAVGIALILIGLMLGGCNALTPAMPDVNVDEIVTENATPEEHALAIALWDEQRACSGWDERLFEFPVVVVDEPFICGFVLAAGCYDVGRIRVVRQYFEGALSHEYLHLLMSKRGYPPDYDHSTPIWAKCDTRNR